jgi:hypothetical protein
MFAGRTGQIGRKAFSSEVGTGSLSKKTRKQKWSRHSPCEHLNRWGGLVPKRDSSTGLRFAMLSTYRPEHAPDDGVFEDARSACVALVPVAQEAQWSRPQVRRALPDPTFLAQLIATAEQIPQTRSLRRAATADALSAYSVDLLRVFQVSSKKPRTFL